MSTTVPTVRRVLVTGATGNVGGPALQALRALGVPARAALRRPPAGADPEDTVAFDFADRGTWDAALEGCDGLVLIRPPQISDMDATLNALLDHAAGRLRHVVFLSVAGAESNRVIPHAKVEAHLARHGLPATLLRAGFFGQNLCGPYREDIRDDDRLYVPAGRGRASWVDTRDLGEAAARAFLDPDSVGAAWLLTGPEVRSFAEVATLLSETLGRPIRYVPANPAAYVWHLRRRRGLPWAQAMVYAALHLAVRFGAEDRVDPTL